MPTYTFFFRNEKNEIVSPFFNSESEAMQWLNNIAVTTVSEKDAAL